MRILYICNEYPPAIHGGIGVFTRTLAERLARSGHDIAVIGYASHVSGAAECVENGVRVMRLPWPRSDRALRLGGLRIDSSVVAVRKALSEQTARFAAAFRPDLVESHDWSGPLWMAPWRPWVVRLHGASSILKSLATGKAPRLMRFLERRNVRLADAVVSPSRFMGATTMRLLGLPRKSFTTLPHGVDIRRFCPGAKARRANEVLIVGTIKKQKGIHELFRAIPRILEALPRTNFTLAGRYAENPADPCSRESLLRSLGSHLCRDSENSFKQRVRFLGPVSQQDLPHLYRRATIAVFPSHREAFGLACAEAMSCGTPVAVANSGAAGELVDNERSGLLVEPCNSEALASAVVRLLGDSVLRRRIGAAARSRIAASFNLDDVAVRNVVFYEQVVSRFATRQSVHA